MALPPHLSLDLPDPSDPQPTHEFPSSGPGVTPEPAPRTHVRWLPVVLVVAVLAIIGVSVGIGVSASGSSEPAPVAQPGQATMSSLSGMTSSAAVAALRSLGFTHITTSPSDMSGVRRVVSQTPATGSVVSLDTPVVLVLGTPPAPTTTTPPPPPAPAKAITARDWALIARDPSSHVGESIVVYGQVTQFDSATGRTTFRANVDGVKHPVRYGYADYDTNTFLTSVDAASLGDLVQKDLFRAEVVVAGAYSYETTMGGTLTVPQLLVTRIEVTGQAK